MVSRERGPAEPRSMYSRSRRRRDRDRRHAILQAQAQSYVPKRLLWHRPRDDVAGATGQGNVSYVAPETIDLTSSGLESISYVGMSAVDVMSNTESGAPLSAPPSGYTGSKLGETVGLNVFTSDTGSLDSEGSIPEPIPCLGKSFTYDAPVVSPADAQASERMYQLAEIIGASKTLPSTLGLWALVVDAPCDACAMSRGLLATMIQDDDTEFKGAATPYDQDSLLERAIMTGWKCYEEGVRDMDELVAAAMEAIEGDITDHDMCMDLVQTIQEVFDPAVFPED